MIHQFGLYSVSVAVFILSAIAVLFPSCNPEAKFETKDVEIYMDLQTVSAGFVECSFSTNKDAYYLVACEPARKGIDPMSYQKQFMMMALDSANIEYIAWRDLLLKEGEFNVAPFASHALSYGKTDQYFTNLTPDTDYWIYAFVVNPETLKPAGKLYLMDIHTFKESIYDVHFEYRIRGIWDYIYPLNPDGQINNHFPYVASTIDSLTLVEDAHMGPVEYFETLFTLYSTYDIKDFIRYGVQVIKNDGLNSDEEFKPGHTYYTAIVSYDGFLGNNVIYKFTWTGEDFEAYFRDEDSIVDNGEDE